MKKIFLTSFILLFLLVGNADASVNSDFTNHGAPAGNFYQSFPEVLVLDITIPANNGEVDELNVITIKNSGTALNASNIEKITFWKDAGPTGFQGMGIDEELGIAVWYDLGQYWYLKNLSEVIPVNGLRIFASAETTYTFSKTTYIQMMVSVLNDQNSNSSFDLGDTGIFVSSDNDGPTNEGIVNANFQTLYKAAIDQFAPKTNITNLTDEQVITGGDFAITGKSKDQGGSIMSWTKIVIDNEEFDVVTSDSYLNWEYTANFSAGSHTISVKSSDQLGNQTETEQITITAEEPEPTCADGIEYCLTQQDCEDQGHYWYNSACNLEPETAPEEPTGINSGDLIKASSASVYYYGTDNKRYVFPTEKTYKTWYTDFSNVKTITSDELASIAIGGNVTYRPGVKMIKITTDPKVYAVAKGGILRWVQTESLAQSLYGENWNQMIEDVPDAFFTNYTMGDLIESTADFNPQTETDEVASIADDKELE